MKGGRDGGRSSVLAQESPWKHTQDLIGEKIKREKPPLLVFADAETRGLKWGQTSLSVVISFSCGRGAPPSASFSLYMPSFLHVSAGTFFLTVYIHSCVLGRIWFSSLKYQSHSISLMRG